MQNLNKLLEEVNYAYENVSFYQKKLDQLGVKPTDMTEETALSLLPLTEKRDYRKNFPMGVIAKGFSLNHPMLTKSQSSGTTGERLVTYEIGMNLLMRAVGCAEIHSEVSQVFTSKGRKICRYAAPNCSDVECANPNSVMADRILADGTLVLPVYHDLLTTSEQMINRAIEEILEYKPDLFYVDPTHFAFLLREFKKRNITPPMIPVMTSYSAATRVSQRQIEEFYPLDSHFTELLSSSEMGWIAMKCQHGNLHLNDDHFFFEINNKDGSSTEPGEVGELCISSIDQGALPHLRYQTGDMARLVEQPCECGSHRRQIIMEGRLTHFITQQGEPVISPQQIDQLIGAPLWLDQYQLEQNSDTQFSFKIMVNDCYNPGVEKEFVGLLQDALKQAIDVQVDVVDYIASERSGKFQPVKGLQ